MPKPPKPKKKIGRPRIIKTPEDMDRMTDEYLETRRKDGTPITLRGLILHMGLTDFSHLDKYGRREGFEQSVKRAKMLVAEDYERDLRRQKPVGSIFALKNFSPGIGWADVSKYEVERTLRVDLSKLPHDLVDRIADGEDIRAVLASAAATNYKQIAAAVEEIPDGEAVEIPPDGK